MKMQGMEIRSYQHHLLCVLQHELQMYFDACTLEAASGRNREKPFTRWPEQHLPGIQATPLATVEDHDTVPRHRTISSSGATSNV